MPTNQSNDMMVYCSFSGKNQDEVQKIIAGNNAFICNECVELAQEIIREELAEGSLVRPFRSSKTNRTPQYPQPLCHRSGSCQTSASSSCHNHYKRINFHENREEDNDVDLQNQTF